MFQSNLSRLRRERRLCNCPDALPFGCLWYGERNAVSNAVGYAIHHSRSHNAVIRVYDATDKRHRDARAQGRVLNVHKIRANFDNKR